MIIDRRSFIEGTLGTLPMVAALLSTDPTPSSDASLLHHQTSWQAADTNSIVFKIDGWDSCDTTMDNQILIRINQAWRAAWR